MFSSFENNHTKSVIVELVSDDIALDEIVIKAEVKSTAGLTNIEERDKEIFGKGVSKRMRGHYPEKREWE